MNRLPVICCLLAFCLLTPASAEDELPLAPLAGQSPTIDGDLSDACWKAALPASLDGYCDNARRAKGDKPADVTEARVTADADNLYVALTCQESHAEGPWVYRNDKLAARVNSHVLGGDYVAVAIDMGRVGLYNYYFFAVNPAGELYRCFTWPHRFDLVLRDIALPAAQSAAKFDKAAKQWTVELKVPLKEMLRYPADGVPKIIGLDLRRVQWGADRGKSELEIYWTGMGNVTGNRMQPQYDHMATWKPLFEAFPNYPNSYAAAKGWVQLVYPESFGHVRLASGTLDNKLVAGQGRRLRGLISSRAGWSTTEKQREDIARMFDRPRMEYWDDLRKADRPKTEPEIVTSQPPAAGQAVRFTGEPKLTTDKNATQIAFTVSAPTDVTVAVLDSHGRVVRHLAAGVLGPRAPKPFAPGQLAQTLLWDHNDDFGKPVPAGKYKVAVRLGLKPVFDHAILLDRANYWYQDPTPTAKGIDIENMPNPKLNKSLGHFSMGTINYMSVDRQREELYIQTQHVYDGRTGRKLRDLSPQGPRVSDLTSYPRTGELFRSPVDDLLYMTGPHEVWRFDRDGKPVAFPALGRHFIPELWGGHSNPHRGICVGFDGSIYKVHHYLTHTSMESQVTRIAPDGRIADYGFIEIYASAAGLRVDREGNVYVGCVVQPADALPPKDLAGMPDATRTRFKRLYGSIVKFGPNGGIIRQDPAGKLAAPTAKGMAPMAAEGATWVRPGFSPMLSRIGDDAGGPACSCRNGRFDLDDYARLFIPDAIAGRVEVADSNGNTIVRIGQRRPAGTATQPEQVGSPEVDFGWATVVAASDEAVYVADYLRYRVVRMKMQYGAAAEADADVPK